MGLGIGQGQGEQPVDRHGSGLAPQPGGGGPQFTFVVAHQEQDAGIATGQRQGFRQHPIQQTLKMVLGRQRRPDIEKTANRGFHQSHRLGQLVDFGDDRMDRDRFVKVEAPNPGRFADQAVQVAGDPAGQQPGDRQRQQHQTDGDQDRLIADARGVGQQFALGHGQRQR